MNCTFHQSLPNRHSPAQVVFGQQSRLLQWLPPPNVPPTNKPDPAPLEEALLSLEAPEHHENEEDVDEFEGIESNHELDMMDSPDGWSFPPMYR